jgi:hypothetical protein
MFGRGHDAMRFLTGLFVAALALSARTRAQTFAITHSRLIYIAKGGAINTKAVIEGYSIVRMTHGTLRKPEQDKSSIPARLVLLQAYPRDDIANWRALWGGRSGGTFCVRI